jgi:response regulator RpfG family c-di-GMP phosphodiesterase
VDDEMPIRNLLKYILDINDYRCAMAADAKEARNQLKTKKFEIVLCDVNMPGETGIDFIQYLFSKYPDTVVIMITAADDPELAEKLIESGAYGYIIKPFKAAEVRINVSNALRRRRLEIENEIHRGHLEQLVVQRTSELQATMEKLQKSMEGIIQAMATTVETRDPYTAGHQRRVTHLALAIAEEMSLTTDQKNGIKMAGEIHDLGKISIPAEILSKPTQLNKMEYDIIKTHPQIGFGILKDIDFPWPVARIVYQHHERINGNGYPEGIQGNEILQEARTLTVADVVEAMASHRPYRPGLGIETALDEISQHKGILYDSDAVDACLLLFKEKRYSLE